MARNTDFKIGDRVRIRSWEDMESEYGLDYRGHIRFPDYRTVFAIDMRHLCGRTAEIVDITGSWVKLTNWSDYRGDVNWTFTKEMLNTLCTFEPTEICIPGTVVSNILITQMLVDKINNATVYEEVNQQLLRIQGYYVPRDCVTIKEN